jgi:hypothetical protein
MLGYGYKEQLDAAAELQSFWKAVLPETEVPPLSTFLLWNRYSQEVLERGIVRAARKFAKMKATATPMTSEDAARYCSAVLRDEARERAQ